MILGQMDKQFLKVGSGHTFKRYMVGLLPPFKICYYYTKCLLFASEGSGKSCRMFASRG